MGILLEIHYVVAFLLVLCAIVFSWTSLGRRVVSAVAILQLVLGITLAGLIGAKHVPLPPLIWLHILCTFVVLGSYGFAMRYGRRAGGARIALAFSVAGAFFIFLTFYIGLHMARVA
ncbi:MAG: hypothetical protein M3R51_06830 [Candidatus Eremiobacteraeota bacterium]|nr:hypothetical protein [Candidatus Eremiobacteraeota bacterium]